MILDQVLSLLRRLIDETDLETATLTDLELLEYIRDAAQFLGLRKIANMDQLVIQEFINLPNYGITPEATVQQAHMLCLQAASDILSDEYRSKISRGELGISWRSGLEEESTIKAADAWQNTIDDFISRLDLLITYNKRYGNRVQ